MKLLYCAGPYRADTAWGTHQNIQEAWRTAYAVVSTMPGWFPVTPHLCTQNMDGIAPDKYFLDGTEELLCRCDAVLLLPGWEKSAGTANEILVAHREMIPVYHSLSEVPQ